MIDFHSHILPQIDDGSSGVKESLEMLEELSLQGVDTVVSTSHFYATQRSPQEFLARRERAFEQLKARLPENAPRILLGAEVLYFPGMSRMDELSTLCIEGTNILLLEMPFRPWSEHMIREVHDLARSGRYTLMMAHIERYYDDQPASVWDDLLGEGVLMQSNADFFLPFFAGRKALRLLREDRIHLLGTDCHNMTSRPPQMDEALRVIRRRLGAEKLAQIDELGRELLQDVL